MAKLESLAGVGVYTKDLKKSKQFYIKTIGLKLRDEDKKSGYVALGATKGGEDAALNLWEPTPKWGQELYEAGLKAIGGVAGIGFSTTNLKGTIDALKRRGVPAEIQESMGDFGNFVDPDGNVIFIQQPPRPKVRRTGLNRLDFITVVAKDSKKTGDFYMKALGMKRHKMTGEDGQDFTNYTLTSEGTAIMPFTPAKMTYEKPSDYDADMAHLGENTSIGFATRDIMKVQEALLAKGVRFSMKAEKRDWGGWLARFLDPDNNVYAIMQV